MEGGDPDPERSRVGAPEEDADTFSDDGSLGDGEALLPNTSDEGTSRRLVVEGDPVLCNPAPLALEHWYISLASLANEKLAHQHETASGVNSLELQQSMKSNTNLAKQRIRFERETSRSIVQSVRAVDERGQGGVASSSSSSKPPLSAAADILEQMSPSTTPIPIAAAKRLLRPLCPTATPESDPASSTSDRLFSEDVRRAAAVDARDLIQRVVYEHVFYTLRMLPGQKVWPSAAVLPAEDKAAPVPVAAPIAPFGAESAAADSAPADVSDLHEQHQHHHLTVTEVASRGDLLPHHHWSLLDTAPVVEIASLLGGHILTPPPLDTVRKITSAVGNHSNGVKFSVMCECLRLLYETHKDEPSASETTEATVDGSGRSQFQPHSTGPPTISTSTSAYPRAADTVGLLHEGEVHSTNNSRRSSVCSTASSLNSLSLVPDLSANPNPNLAPDRQLLLQLQVPDLSAQGAAAASGVSASASGAAAETADYHSLRGASFSSTVSSVGSHGTGPTTASSRPIVIGTAQQHAPQQQHQSHLQQQPQQHLSRAKNLRYGRSSIGGTTTSTSLIGPSGPATSTSSNTSATAGLQRTQSHYAMVSGGGRAMLPHPHPTDPVIATAIATSSGSFAEGGGNFNFDPHHHEVNLSLSRRGSTASATGPPTSTLIVVPVALQTEGSGQLQLRDGASRSRASSIASTGSDRAAAGFSTSAGGRSGVESFHLRRMHATSTSTSNVLGSAATSIYSSGTNGGRAQQQLLLQRSTSAQHVTPTVVAKSFLADFRTCSILFTQGLMVKYPLLAALIVGPATTETTARAMRGGSVPAHVEVEGEPHSAVSASSPRSSTSVAHLSPGMSASSPSLSVSTAATAAAGAPATRVGAAAVVTRSRKEIVNWDPRACTSSPKLKVKANPSSTSSPCVPVNFNLAPSTSSLASSPRPPINLNSGSSSSLDRHGSINTKSTNTGSTAGLRSSAGHGIRRSSSHANVLSSDARALSSDVSVLSSEASAHIGAAATAPLFGTSTSSEERHPSAPRRDSHVKVGRPDPLHHHNAPVTNNTEQSVMNTEHSVMHTEQSVMNTEHSVMNAEQSVAPTVEIVTLDASRCVLRVVQEALHCALYSSTIMPLFHRLADAENAAWRRATRALNGAPPCVFGLSHDWCVRATAGGRAVDPRCALVGSMLKLQQLQQQVTGAMLTVDTATPSTAAPKLGVDESTGAVFVDGTATTTPCYMQQLQDAVHLNAAVPDPVVAGTSTSTAVPDPVDALSAGTSASTGSTTLTSGGTSTSVVPTLSSSTIAHVAVTTPSSSSSNAAGSAPATPTLPPPSPSAFGLAVESFRVAISTMQMLPLLSTPLTKVAALRSCLRSIATIDITAPAHAVERVLQQQQQQRRRPSAVMICGSASTSVSSASTSAHASIADVHPSAVISSSSSAAAALVAASTSSTLLSPHGITHECVRCDNGVTHDVGADVRAAASCSSAAAAYVHSQSMRDETESIPLSTHDSTESSAVQSAHNETAVGPDERSGKRMAVGADDLIPRLCFVLCAAALPDLFSELSFLEHCLPDDVSLGEDGYAVVSLRGAAMHVMSIVSRTAGCPV